jgi:hypothetical protein
MKTQVAIAVGPPGFKVKVTVTKKKEKWFPDTFNNKLLQSNLVYSNLYKYTGLACL